MNSTVNVKNALCEVLLPAKGQAALIADPIRKFTGNEKDPIYQPVIQVEDSGIAFCPPPGDNILFHSISTAVFPASSRRIHVQVREAALPC